MRRFFIDMDGVLAIWEDASIEEMTSPGFFLSRKPDRNVIEMARMLLDGQGEGGYEVYILSSYLLPISRREKIAWNAEHLGIPEERQIYVPYGDSKASAFDGIGGIGECDVLLDDFSDNLREWPGVAVKMYNGRNGTRGTWTGYSVRNSMDPEKMAAQLEGISLMEQRRARAERAGAACDPEQGQPQRARRAGGR